MSLTPDRLVAEYRQRLSDATAGLSPGIRAEVLSSVEEHIRDARAGLPSDDPDAVQAILAALGTPDQIAMAARDETDPGTTQPQNRSSGQRLYDAVTVSLLAAGTLVIPIVGWLVGVVMLWRGPRWTVRDRVLGTLVVPLGPAAVLSLPILISSFLPSATVECAPTADGGLDCRNGGLGPDWVGWLVMAVYVVAGVAVCLHLANRARRAGRARPAPLPVPAE